MSANVDPEEVQAILGMMEQNGSAAAQVSQRDFRRPRRLSQPQIEEITAKLTECLAPLGEHLAETVGSPCQVTLASVGEVSAEGLFDDAGEHPAVLRCLVGGQPAWAAWDPAAAVGALERILGAAPSDVEARRLTRVERRVLGGFLTHVVNLLAGALGREATDHAIAEDAGQIGSWRDGAGRPDAHRLHVELGVEGAGEPSVLHIYLPGFQELHGPSGTDLAPGLELPRHLERVVVGVEVRLAACEIPLSQLLALEAGDVIPTPVRIGAPAVVLVEGEALAAARLGTHRGHFAVRVEHFIDPTEESR
ncbi:MAG: FliM/FliN family flagellar motor C-terminal domain-containing protein [Planctomycetota bacterium]